MVILTVPYHGYPQHGVLSPVTAPYAFHEEQFPLLSSSGSKSALSSKDLSTSTRTWVEVLLYGSPKTALSGILTPTVGSFRFVDFT
jgi:hypothetical protein